MHVLIIHTAEDNECILEVRTRSSVLNVDIFGNRLSSERANFYIHSLNQQTRCRLQVDLHQIIQSKCYSMISIFESLRRDASAEPNETVRYEGNAHHVWPKMG